MRAASIAPLVFAPSGQAASFYNDPPIEPAQPDPLADAIIEAIEAHHADIGTAAPRPDGRLYKAAAELATIASEDAPLAYPLVEFALQRQGIIEPSPHILVIWGPLEQPEAIMQKLSERLPEILNSAKFARIGIGSAPRKKNGEGAIILALQSSHLTTKPIPRELPAGGFIVVNGRIHDGYTDPAVFVTREDGSVDRPKLKRRRSDRFRVSISCAGRRGRQQIEVTANDASGSNVLANFPVWCNQRAPDRVTVEPTVDDLRVVTNATEAEALMLELVNRDRKKHRLPPLLAAANVANVARAHSQEMHDTGVVAHVSPTTGSAADRIRRAKIRTSIVLENVARAYGVAEAEDGLMNSPGHRANLLSPKVTHIGIGIVLGEEVAGQRELFVTQLFTRVPLALSPRQVKKRIAAQIRQRSRVVRDKSLEAFAQEYAGRLATGMPADKAAREISKKLESVAARFRRVTSAVMTVADVEAIDTDDVFNDKRVTHYGLGVAQGSHAELGDNALFVIVLLGQAL